MKTTLKPYQQANSAKHDLLKKLFEVQVELKLYRNEHSYDQKNEVHTLIKLLDQFIENRLYDTLNE
ncbi:MAG: hypothetical protein CSA03_04185 [Bacteroidetes bacterium]|nr:MAG: hypothetical protein CSA03_04185 [Bacteroidota bacterium]